MDDILKISDFDDEDPFKAPIREMSLTTGALPIAPLGGSGFEREASKSTKKRKKKKNKGYFSVDKQSGKPVQKGANILFSGIDDEEYLEEAKKPKRKSRGKLRSQKKIDAAKDKKAAPILVPPEKFARDLPQIFKTGGIEYLRGRDPEVELKKIDQQIEGNPALINAKQRMALIVGTLRQAGQKIDYCVLLRHYNITNNIYSNILNQDPEDDWETDVGWGGGISMVSPPTGWWGIHKWTPAKLDRYKKLYIDQIYAKYLQRVRVQYDEHVAECGFLDCGAIHHVMFLKEFYCEGTNPDTGKSWSLGDAVKLMAEEMDVRKRVFQGNRRGGKVKPQTPPEDIERLKRARQIEKERGAWASIREVPDEDFSASWRQFYGMEESRNPSKNTPLEISKMIEDPDDTSL